MCTGPGVQARCTVYSLSKVIGRCIALDFSIVCNWRGQPSFPVTHKVGNGVTFVFLMPRRENNFGRKDASSGDWTWDPSTVGPLVCTSLSHRNDEHCQVHVFVDPTFLQKKTSIFLRLKFHLLQFFSEAKFLHYQCLKMHFIRRIRWKWWWLVQDVEDQDRSRKSLEQNIYLN